METSEKVKKTRTHEKFGFFRNIKDVEFIHKISRILGIGESAEDTTKSVKEQIVKTINAGRKEEHHIKLSDIVVSKSLLRQGLLLIVNNKTGEMVYQSRPNLISDERHEIDRLMKEHGGVVLIENKPRALAEEAKMKASLEETGSIEEEPSLSEIKAHPRRTTKYTAEELQRRVDYLEGQIEQKNAELAHRGYKSLEKFGETTRPVEYEQHRRGKIESEQREFERKVVKFMPKGTGVPDDDGGDDGAPHGGGGGGGVMGGGVMGGGGGVLAVASPPKRGRALAALGQRTSVGAIKKAVNATLRQKRREVLRPEQRLAVRTALLEEALKDNDPYARDEAEQFLIASKGNLKGVSDAQARQPRMSFDEQRELRRKILSGWYEGVDLSFEKQIKDREGQVKLSSIDARKKALEQFKLK